MVSFKHKFKIISASKRFIKFECPCGASILMDKRKLRRMVTGKDSGDNLSNYLQRAYEDIVYAFRT